MTVPSLLFLLPPLPLKHRHLPSTPRLSNYTFPPISYKKENYSITILNIVLGSTLYFIYLHPFDLVPRASVAYFILHTDLVICAVLQTKFLIDPFTRRKASYNYKTIEHCVRHPNAPNLDKSSSNRRPDRAHPTLLAVGH